jgi:hypothetical protein
MTTYSGSIIKAAIIIALMIAASCGKKNADTSPVGEESTSELDPSSVTGEINGSDPAGGGVGGVFPNSPSISSLKLTAPENQQLLEDATAFNVPFKFSDDVDLVSCIDVTAKSNSSSLFDKANLVVGGTAPDCTITITPNLNQFGSARITLMATDKLSNMVSQSFEVTVDSVDDRPSISNVLDQTTAKNTTLSGVSVTITDPDSPLTCSGSLSASSSNSLVLANNGIVISGDAPDCLVSLSPVANGVGTSVVTLSIGEGELRITDTFDLVVSSTNATPSLLAPANQTVNEDQTLSNVAFTLNDADGEASCLNVAVSTSNSLIASSGNFVISGNAPNCLLSVTPKANMVGSLTVTLEYTDPTSLSTSASFSLSVSPVNDGPSMDSISSATIAENSSLSNHSVTVQDIDSTLSCSSSLSAVVADESILQASLVSFSGTAPNCKMSASPELNAYGSTQVTVSVSDGELSDSKSFTLNVTRATIPSAPVLANSSSVTSNATSLVISGSCTSGLVVNLSGSVMAADVLSPANQLSQACNSGLFSFTVKKELDGIYSFALRQVNGSSVSAQVFKNWTRDTQNPSAPVISSPSNLTYASGPGSLLIQGSCEQGSQVVISRNGTPLTPVITCSTEEFSIVVDENLDGVFSYAVKQIDLAENESLSASLSWAVDSTVPATPVLNQAAVNYNSSGAFTISGSCTGTNKVYIHYLDVDISGSPVTCSSGAFTISTSQASDGSYDYLVYQEDSVNELDSGSVELTWVRDSISPDSPMITYPTSAFSSPNYLIIRASCEVSASVYLKEDGTVVNPGAPTECVDGNYEYQITKNSSQASVFRYKLYQVDEASNTSLDSTEVVWNFDPLSINPVTIDTPVETDFATANDTLLVSGLCDQGLQVTISGLTTAEILEPVGSLQQECSENLDYQFVVKKSVAGVSNISIVQSNELATSSPVTFTWTFDNIAPSLAFLTKPSDPNYFILASFTFSTDDLAAVIECSVDGQEYVTCTSGYSNSLLSNGTHTLVARAVDSVGNTSSLLSYSWVQNSYKTLALYHFTAGTDFDDSSVYANAALTNTSSTSGTGKFGEDRVFGSGKKLTVSDKPQFDTSTKEFTVEAWIKMSTLPTNSTWQTIVAKNTTGSSGVSFNFQIGKSSKKMKLQAKLSSNGSTISTYTTGGITFSANTWYHVALTYNKGAYKIFLSGVRKKSGTAAEKTIFDSPADLSIGTDGSNQFTGEIDELRFSQVSRYSTTFTPATSAFSAD